MNKITYNTFLLMKTQIIEYDIELINKLNEVAENIKSLDLNRTTVFKDKFWNKRVFESSDKIITLLNILTEGNIDEIFNKIIEIDISITELDNVVNHIHKKCCNEYQMLNIYIIIINKIIHSGIYSFKKNMFWNKLIDNVQDAFINEEILTTQCQFYTGNLLLSFYLCKNNLLSLKVLDYIFTFFKESHDNEIVINIIFKLIEKIPIFQNEYFIKQINSLLKLEVPFRIKFKFKQQLAVLNEKDNLENKLLNFMKDYKVNKSTINDLSVLITKVTNFRKPIFFKTFIIQILKSDLNDSKIKALLQFVLKKKYKPTNSIHILNSIKRELINIKKTSKSCDVVYNKIINKYYVKYI